ncbi:hypothetical protein DT816_05805 [Salmonella enterica]|uniref:Phage tail protein n=3 Tax=Salmonella enterica I TaxID=59201 RepID=A0A3V2YER0_SALNE|nr:hypothetical protein [Salmonella enterica]EAA2704538.1 hypothetical protein [Salmonella enterica subsp. enterica serovar Saintpaul]EBG9236475.1 hypothetical protein [Salmonella enterica subsp. enterica serovar Stanley]EBV0941046.1 hypothetical protein [Salmonella enterica subsp. enterica serovar Kottbus]EBW8372795.1 hypothetical protein [Salmonella enterica subsp. enterica serovar Panama]EBX8208319.1 hypothetical protein [Salmonella enterica subsp. enterica serovar Javiana]ECD2915655.1 hyp
MAIVNINVSVTSPPKPSQLLKSGALVSTGGTTLAAGSYQLLTSKDDLKNIVAPAKAISSLAWAGNTVTVTLSENHGWSIDETIPVVISGAAPAAYNGAFTASVTGEKTFTYPLNSEPGTATVTGTVTSVAAGELQQMNTTYWAQGTSRAVYVLELGEMKVKSAVAALGTFIDEDTSLGNTYQKFFSYLVPREWDAEPTFKTLANNYTSPGALVKFFVTTTIATYQEWVSGKYPNVFAGVEAPSIGATEFSMAAPFQSSLANDPGSSNMVPPMAYRFMYGVTEYPPAGNGTLLKTLQDNHINYIGTAAEGGLSNKMLVAGHMLDGMPFNYWYSVAWCAINLELDLANEVINGSNTTVNPLYYDQQGIGRLQRRALKTLRSGISYGLILGQVIDTQLTQESFNAEYEKGSYAGNAVINAVPFADYTSLNQSDYADGKYNGLSAVVTPRRGFESITFNLNVTNFVGA